MILGTHTGHPNNDQRLEILPCELQSLNLNPKPIELLPMQFMDMGPYSGMYTYIYIYKGIYLERERERGRERERERETILNYQKGPLCQGFSGLVFRL